MALTLLFAIACLLFYVYKHNSKEGSAGFTKGVPHKEG